MKKNIYILGLASIALLTFSGCSKKPILIADKSDDKTVLKQEKSIAVSKDNSENKTDSSDKTNNQVNSSDNSEKTKENKSKENSKSSVNNKENKSDNTKYNNNVSDDNKASSPPKVEVNAKSPEEIEKVAKENNSFVQGDNNPEIQETIKKGQDSAKKEEVKDSDKQTEIYINGEKV